MWWRGIVCLCPVVATGWWRELPTRGAGLDVWDALVPAQMAYDVTPISRTVITVLFSNQPYYIRRPRFELQTMIHPLLCDLVILTAHNLTQPDYDCRDASELPEVNSENPKFQSITEPTSLYDAFRQAYAHWQPGMCHINIQTPIASALQSDRDFNATLAIEYRSIERYRAALVLSELGLQNKLIHSSGGKPPVIFMDRATIPTNKFFTPRSLIHQLDDGFAVCEQDCKLHPANVTYRDVAFALSVNSMCQEDQQLLSESSFYFRPSRAAAALFATILHLGSRSMLSKATGDLAFRQHLSVPHHLRLLMRALELLFSDEVGDLKMSLHTICHEPETWHRPGADPGGSEARPVHLVDRLIRPELILERPEGVGVRAIYGSDAKCLKENEAAGHEPRYLSVMPPRWLASPACPWHLLGPDTKNVWHPTDFGAHFKGCEGVGHFTDVWRAAVNEDILPWIDEDEDWGLWRSQGVLYWETERSHHLNYLLSPPCPST